MDFFAMKRKKLQGYCKKHGIPANLKNIEMAERLSLIYQGEEKENPAPPRLQAGAGGVNVEVIDLDSDSGAEDVQMETLDTVARNESYEKTTLSDELKLDVKQDQFLTTSPESEVDHKVDSDACEVKSVSSQKTSQGREESNMKLAPEDDTGSSYEEETIQMSVNMGNIEDNHHASPGEDEKVMEREADVLEDTRSDEPEKLDEMNMQQESIMENVNHLPVTPKESSGCLVEPVQKLDDNDCEMDETAGTCLDVKNTDENSNAVVGDILDEVHSSSFEHSDETPVQVLPTDPSNEVEASDLDVPEMVATGTAVKTADTSAVKFDSSQKLNITPASDKMIGTSTELINNSVSPKDIGVCDMEENIQIGVIEGQVDQSQEKLMDLSPNWLNNPKTPTNADIGICDLEDDLQIGSNKENIDPSAVDTSNDEDLTEVVSEELDNDLTEGEDANMANVSDLLQDVCGTGDSSEAVNHLHLSPKESRGRSVEQDHNLDATICLDASTAAKNIDENTNLTVGDMLDDSSVQFPPIDPFCEVETNDLDVHNMVVTGTASEKADTSVVKVMSEELASNLMEEEVEDVGDKFDIPETGNGSGEPINQGSIDTPHGLNVNNADLLHVSLVGSSSPFVGGQVQKSDDNDMPGGDYDLGNCGFAVDVICSDDKSITAEDTDEKTVVSLENHEGHSPSGKYSDDEDLQLAASAEFGKKLAEVEFDLLKDEALKSSSIKCPQGSSVNDFNLGEFSSYFDGVVQKSDDKIMHCGSGKSESEDYTFYFPDESIAAKDTEGKNNASMQNIPYEGISSTVQYSDDTQDLFMSTGELISSSGPSIYPMATLDACVEEMLRSSEKTSMVANPEECFDPTTLRDVVMETCNMNESMQSDMMEMEDMQGEGRNFFENSDVHDDIDGFGAEDGNQSTEMASRKRKMSDAISDEDVKEHELVPTVHQTSEMDSSNFRLQQLFASDTASGDEDAYQKKLDSPSKATPMIHKENIKFDKKEEVRSRNKFAKRQPLQDLK